MTMIYLSKNKFTKIFFDFFLILFYLYLFDEFFKINKHFI